MNAKKEVELLQIVEKILNLDPAMRFAAVLDLKGNILEGIMQENKITRRAGINFFIHSCVFIYFGPFDYLIKNYFFKDSILQYHNLFIVILIVEASINMLRCRREISKYFSAYNECVSVCKTRHSSVCLKIINALHSISAYSVRLLRSSISWIIFSSSRKRWSSDWGICCLLFLLQRNDTNATTNFTLAQEKEDAANVR